MGISRRTLMGQSIAATLGLASGLTWAMRRALAIGPDADLRFGRLELGDSSNPRPSALRRIAWETEKRTSISVDLAGKTVNLASKDLHETPLLYLAGDREFDIPPEREIDNLRRFLTFGGFLIIDSAEGSTDGAFDGSVRQLIDTLYPRPETGLEIVPSDHVVYKSFYLLKRPAGRVAIAPSMEGIIRDKRLVVAYVQNDMGGAWSRDDFGNYDFQCEPNGERQRELSFRMGVNLVMYALCLDYKTDQVHVPFIMRRRRWRPADGAEVADPIKRPSKIKGR